MIMENIYFGCNKYTRLVENPNNRLLNFFFTFLMSYISKSNYTYINTYTHTHTHTRVYINACVCVKRCSIIIVCIYELEAF